MEQYQFRPIELGDLGAIELIKEVTEKLREIKSGFLNNKMEDKNYCRALESLNQLHKKVDLTKEIREFSAAHMYDVLMGNHWSEFARDLIPSPDNATATTERIYGIHKLSKEYIEEHYLHHTQELLQELKETIYSLMVDSLAILNT